MKYCQICEITDSDNEDMYCERCGGLIVERPFYEDPLTFKKKKRFNFRKRLNFPYINGNLIFILLYTFLVLGFCTILFGSLEIPSIMLIIPVLIIISIFVLSDNLFVQKK